MVGSLMYSAKHLNVTFQIDFEKNEQFLEKKCVFSFNFLNFFIQNHHKCASEIADRFCIF